MNAQMLRFVFVVHPLWNVDLDAAEHINETNQAFCIQTDVASPGRTLLVSPTLPQKLFRLLVQVLLVLTEPFKGKWLRDSSTARRSTRNDNYPSLLGITRRKCVE